MYPTRTQIDTIQTAYRDVCRERGHTVSDVILNESMPDPRRHEELSTTQWLAEQAALDTAAGNQVHVVYALTTDLPF